MEEIIVEMKKTMTRITRTLDIMDGSACPHRIRMPNYIDKCDINDKPCLLEEGLECDEWNEVREEWEQEDDNVS